MRPELPSFLPSRRLRIVVALCWFAIAPAALAISIDFVTVGNPGNAPDPNYGGFGAISYSFAIGKYEVTNSQYTAFLNSVANVSDAYSLYPDTNNSLQPNNEINVAHSVSRGISRQAISGGFLYSTEANMSEKPVNFATWFSAVRFVNWMANGQPVGTQTDATTENGAYSLNGVMANGFDITRNAINPNTSAPLSFWLPSESEWYKAAFYDPTLAAGSGGYWLYPTQSTTQPTIASATATGDIANPGPNVANYASGVTWNGLNQNLTTVGSAGAESTSYYGTYDQSGNVWEWSEAVVKGGTARGLRQGSANDPTAPNQYDKDFMAASLSDNGRAPQYYYWNAGFRIATAVPEPSAASLFLLAAAWLLKTKTRKKFPSS